MGIFTSLLGILACLLQEIWDIWYPIYKGIKGKDQELIQSSTTPDSGYNMKKVTNTQLNITNQSNRSALSQQGIYIIENFIFSRIFNISQRHYPFVFCLFEDVTDCVI